MICGYALQRGSQEEKQSFYDELKGEWDMHSAGHLVMCLGDLNGGILMVSMGCMEDTV